MRIAASYTEEKIIGLREKMEYNDIPESFKGMPIVLLTAMLMSMAFMGFSGMI